MIGRKRKDVTAMALFHKRGRVLSVVAVSGLAIFGGLAWSQTSADAPELNTTFTSTVKTLVAPVLVTDRAGNIIDGLQPSQFHLYDNTKEQNIHVDAAFQPISVVVAIEKSARVEKILPQIQKLGTLLTQITGREGEAAVVAFDSHLTTVQDFTRDNDKIKVAINNIHAGNSGTRIIDAVEQGIQMLSKRPPAFRRVLLLVSETRDEGSEARLKETLIRSTLSNVLIYSVDITQAAVRFNEKPDQPYPSAMDVTQQNLPMGIPSTPTSMEQYGGLSNRAQFVPLLKEIFIDTKGIFVKDPSTQFARATGGAQFVFLRQKGLEEAITKISEQVHSQYLVTYAPTNAEEGGFHTIAVTIDRQPDYICKTRPGYWIGGGAQ